MFGEEVVLFEDVVETSYIDVGDKDSTPIGGLLHYTSGGPHLVLGPNHWQVRIDGRTVAMTN